MLRKIVLGLATSGLLLGSTANAVPLARDAAPVSASEEVGTVGILVGLVVIALTILVIVGDADEDDAPVSP